MLDSVLLKVERADKHIHDLSAILDGMQPYALGLKRDPQTGDGIVYIETATPVDPIVPLIAGDAIQTLYSALDYLAGELVIANGKVPTSSTAFPITQAVPSTKKQIERYEGQVCGMRQEVADLIKSLNPYRGEDNLFWALHKLNNINKHRTIVAINNAGAFKIGNGPWQNTNPLYEGSELSRIPADAEIYEYVTVFASPCVIEPEADTVNHNLLLVLNGCGGLVRRTVDLFQQYR
jgi:hypothetical protein